MGEKDTVVSKQQLSNEFLNGFRACEEALKVEETIVSSETLRCMMLKEMENNFGARTHPCLTPLEMGKLPDGDRLCFT